MMKSVKTHKKQLLFAATVCLFSILTVSTGKIFVNLLDTNAQIYKEKQAWIKISRNITSELTISQQKEWSDFAIENPEIFLRANTSNYYCLDRTPSTTNAENITHNSIRNILANIIITTKEHIKKAAQY